MSDTYGYFWRGDMIHDGQPLRNGERFGTGTFSGEPTEDLSDARFTPDDTPSALELTVDDVLKHLRAGRAVAVRLVDLERDEVAYIATKPFMVEQTKFAVGDELGRGWAPRKLDNAMRAHRPHRFVTEHYPPVGAGHALARLETGLVEAVPIE